MSDPYEFTYEDENAGITVDGVCYLSITQGGPDPNDPQDAGDVEIESIEIYSASIYCEEYDEYLLLDTKHNTRRLDDIIYNYCDKMAPQWANQIMEDYYWGRGDWERDNAWS